MLETTLRKTIGLLLILAVLVITDPVRANENAPSSSALTSNAITSAPARQPNIVIVLIDDAALMDLGVYGGEAKTPTIDSLAANGALFTQYRTSPLCAPTRAMLLTGIDNHRTGVATIPEVLPPEQQGKPGYSMSLEPGVLTLADRLRAVGYRTFMTGKWHLGDTGEEMPQAHGFDRSFALAASGADNWDDKSYIPFYRDAPWFEDGKEVDLPDDFYSSEFIVDKTIEYIESTDSAKPFLAYLPFQAIHLPVQAPQEFIDNYKGVYDAGWDILRAERHQTAQQLGLIAAGSKLAPMQEDSRRWTELNDTERTVYAARMEVNAAMLEAMDHHVGRLIEYLEVKGKLENTIFVVTSDNGPEPTRGDNQRGLGLWMWLNGYHIDLEGVGGQGSWGFIGTEWATAAASPSAYYKFYATEGGVRAPLIITGPDIATMRIDSPAMVTDLVPTLLDIVQTPQAPADAVPITGRSLLPVLTGTAESVYAADDIRAIEVSGNSALYQGDYKITRSLPPIGNGEWHLFNLREDPGETTSLNKTQADRLVAMIAEYQRYAAEMGVLEMPDGYSSMHQVRLNTLMKAVENYVLELLFAAFALLIAIALLTRLRKKNN